MKSNQMLCLEGAASWDTVFSHYNIHNIFCPKEVNLNKGKPMHDHKNSWKGAATCACACIPYTADSRSENEF